MVASFTPTSRRAWTGASALLVLAGCGGGGSASSRAYDWTRAVALADLNGDGRPDAVSAVSTFGHGAPHPGFISLRVQNASAPGTFQDPSRLTTGTDPYAIAVGDLNGDGKADLVVANTQTTPDPIQANTISVLLSGASPGSFLPAQQLAVGNRDPLDVAIGDLNGDGRPDIAVAARGGASVLIFFQGPAGAFSTPMAVSLNAEPTALALADLNGDGRLDLAVTTQADTVSVLIQNPSTAGSFAAAVAYAVGNAPVAVRVADLDGDGRADLAVVNAGSAYGGLSVLRQDPAHPGVYLAAQVYDTRDVFGSALAIGDLNGDGKPDLVVANAGAPGFSGSVSVFLQNPARPGILQSPDLYRGYSGPTSIAIGDLNGDGRADLLIADGDPSIRFQDPASPGRFFPPTWLRH